MFNLLRLLREHWIFILVVGVLVLGFIGASAENKESREFLASLDEEEQARIAVLTEELASVNGGTLNPKDRFLLLFEDGHVEIVCYGDGNIIRRHRRFYDNGDEYKIPFRMNPEWVHGIKKTVRQGDPDFNDLFANFVRQ